VLKYFVISIKILRKWC